MNHDVLAEVVQLEIPARPQFVGIARMAVAALAGLRTGFSFERIDDLRLVVSEACTAAIEKLDAEDAPADVRLRLRCEDDPDSLTIVISGPPGCFDGWLNRDQEAEFRIALVSALVDKAEAGASGEDLRLVVLRGAEDDLD